MRKPLYAVLAGVMLATTLTFTGGSGAPLSAPVVEDVLGADVADAHAKQSNCLALVTYEYHNGIRYVGTLLKNGHHIDCLYWAEVVCQLYFWGEWHVTSVQSPYHNQATTGSSGNHYLWCPSSWDMSYWTLADLAAHNQ
ncbi:MAG: hypothetical protein HKN01_01485 [Acidimicrobiia bacterium]|nr:hypothetical protein [Acidimicrobiia bacterium]